MIKKNWMVHFSLIFVLLIFGISSVSAQVPTEDDTFTINGVTSVPAQTTVTVDVELSAQHNLSSLIFPLKFRSADEGDSALEVECDSIHWSDWFWNNIAFLYTGQNAGESYIDSTEKTIDIYGLWGVPPGAEYLPAKDSVLFTIYFTTKTYWDPDVAAKIDTYSIEYPAKYLNILDNSIPANEWIPVFEADYLGTYTWVREIDVEKVNTPENFVLNQNYPNPFNPTTVIRFALPEDSWVRIEVFNILGQKITTLVDEYLTAGYKETGWDGTDSKRTDVASGIYFYKIKTKNFTDIKKMVLLK